MANIIQGKYNLETNLLRHNGYIMTSCIIELFFKHVCKIMFLKKYFDIAQN